MRTVGPRDTGSRLVAGGDAAGTLEIVGPHRRMELGVGHDALRDGCSSGGTTAATPWIPMTRRSRASTRCSCTITIGR